MDKREQRCGGRREQRCCQGRQESQERFEMSILGIFSLRMNGYRVCQGSARNLSIGIVAGATLALLGMWALSRDGQNSRRYL